MGRQIKAKAAHSFVLKKCPAWIASLPHIFVSVSSAGMCQLVSGVLSCACADSWPGNPFQESQVEFCVKPRRISRDTRLMARLLDVSVLLFYLKFLVV